MNWNDRFVYFSLNAPPFIPHTYGIIISRIMHSYFEDKNYDVTCTVVFFIYWHALLKILALEMNMVTLVLKGNLHDDLNVNRNEKNYRDNH